MGQRILITGGEGDLARAIGHAFERAGDRVDAPGRRDLDVADSTSVERYFATAETPDLLIANAGLAEDRLLARTAEDSWDRQLEVNLHGAYRCAKAVAWGMIKRRSGHLVFVASHAACHPAPGQATYAAAKAGLLGFARSLARELGPAGIRVNTLLPGFLETRMTAGVGKDHRTAVLASHCLGRLNTPQATADFLVHLHHHLPHTSGQVFQLDSRPE
ncbi:SDR family oxidoreductase [Haloferula sp. A504]|uniref:SDR family oxidoreductase n=1 Tax=Haloferula sp. A504 TaxID=3373601 RepID=UPI0031C282E4|nr:SDR family oxidoreductase [Verrucomicrobiaceae bacterium E54]